MEQVKDILTKVVGKLSSGEAATDRLRLFQEWESIMGPRLAGRTKPVLNNQGTLVVWVDDSTLAFELSQRYGNAILKRVRAVAGEEKVKKIFFRVGQLR